MNRLEKVPVVCTIGWKDKVIRYTRSAYLKTQDIGSHEWRMLLELKTMLPDFQIVVLDD